MLSSEYIISGRLVFHIKACDFSFPNISPNIFFQSAKQRMGKKSTELVIVFEIVIVFMCDE